MRAKVLSSSGAKRDPLGADAQIRTTPEGERMEAKYGIEPAPMSTQAVPELRDFPPGSYTIHHTGEDLDALRDHLAKEVANLWAVYQRVRDTMRNLESISEPHRTPRMNEITAFAIVNVADLKSAIQGLETVPGPKLPVYSPPPVPPIGPEVIRRR